MRACAKCGEIYDPALGACPKCGLTLPGAGKAGMKIKLTPKVIAFIVVTDLIFFGLVAWFLLKD